MLRTTLKILLAAGLAVVLACVVGSGLYPALPLGTLLFEAAGIVLAVFAFAVLLCAALGMANRATLRMGATDIQWLWFPADPPGLQRLRGRPAAQEPAAAANPPPG